MPTKKTSKDFNQTEVNGIQHSEGIKKDSNTNKNRNSSNPSTQNHSRATEKW